MATVKAPFAVKGKVGNLQLYMRDGKNFVKPATFPSPLPPDYYHTHPRQLENRFRFAGAVAVCSAIYSEFDDHARKVMRPYAYNLIRGRLRQMLKFAPEFWRIEFPVAHHALHQLDLAPELGPSSILRTTLNGPSHRPTHLYLGNLTELATSVSKWAKVHGNAELQLRISLQWIPFRPFYFEHDGRWWISEYDNKDSFPEHRSQWIPARILPEDGITLAAQPKVTLPEDIPYLVGLLLEWREYRPVGPQLIDHPTQ